PVSGKPYWRAIDRGLHLGYRKGKTSGVWVVRRYLGGQNYKLETIAQADDNVDADGKDVLDFWQAQKVARSLKATSRKGGAYTVRDAVQAYLAQLEGRASHHDVQTRVEAFVLPAFGDLAVDALDAEQIRKWHRNLAKTPARRRTAAGKKQAY